MSPKKITIIKIDRPKRKYTRKGDAAMDDDLRCNSADPTPAPTPMAEEKEKEEIPIAQPTKVQVKREILLSPSILSQPTKPIPLDQVTFALSEKPMDVYIYFTIEPMGPSFTKYQFYASRFETLFDHVICYSGPTPPPDYPHSHAVYRESQTIHPMITLHIKVFYVSKRDYTWKVCAENLAKNDRSEYGYHFTQLRMMAGGYHRTRPDHNQKFAVKQGETQYIQLPTLNLEEFLEKSALQIRELNEGLKRLGI
jgi:hypothetical protein